jgi:hypothetical protein
VASSVITSIANKNRSVSSNGDRHRHYGGLLRLFLPSRKESRLERENKRMGKAKVKDKKENENERRIVRRESLLQVHKGDIVSDCLSTYFIVENTRLISIKYGIGGLH